MRGSQIMLRCPHCQTELVVPRDDGDPQEAVSVLIVCLRCDDGDFHSPRFENADGIEIPAIDTQESTPC